MPLPLPSAIRVVRLPGIAQLAAPRGAVPAAQLSWSSKHPLSVDWWWADATVWCEDISDTIVGFSPLDAFISGGDGALSFLATAISADGRQVGLRFLGGSPAQTYTITIILSGSRGEDSAAFDIVLPCAGQIPAGLGVPWAADYSTENNSGAYALL